MMELILSIVKKHGYQITESLISELRPYMSGSVYSLEELEAKMRADMARNSISSTGSTSSGTVVSGTSTETSVTATGSSVTPPAVNSTGTGYVLSSKDQERLDRAIRKLEAILSYNDAKAGAAILDKIIASVDLALSKPDVTVRKRALYSGLRSHCLELIRNDDGYAAYSRFR